MYKITKDGVALDPKLYTIDKVNKTFASKEDGLVIDFAGKNGWLFRIGYSCKITTGEDCFIDARGECIITTGDGCTIEAGRDCNITADHGCVIHTYLDCIICVGERCTIAAAPGCNITTGDGCTIDTGSGCNITAGDQTVIRANWNSVITGGKNCVVSKRYGNEVIKLIAGQTIKLNDHMTEGYEVVKPIETIEIGGLKFNKEEVEDFLKNLKPIN